MAIKQTDTTIHDEIYRQGGLFDIWFDELERLFKVGKPIEELFSTGLDFFKSHNEFSRLANEHEKRKVTRVSHTRI